MMKKAAQKLTSIEGSDCLAVVEAEEENISADVT